MVGFCLLTQPVLANQADDSNVIKFDIPRTVADLSLIEFAEQADVTLLFPFELVKGVKTNDLYGWYSVTQGINSLLADTGLTPEVDDKGHISIVVDQINESEKMITKKNKVAAAVISVISTMGTSAAWAQAAEPKTAQDEVEIISVQGVRGSLVQSMNDKRFSQVIKDSISAEDIGQLPDENIAEALQRVTGIQMSRAADGEGTSVQIRGISDNNVEINGQSTTGTGADRNVNFQDLPSELFSGIEVFKAPTSDQIEGSLGGTINLKTRRPLNIKEDQVGSVTVRAKYNELAEDTSPDINGFLSKNFRDTAAGDFGFVLNLGSKTVVSQTDVYGGGDYDTAPAQWFVRNASGTPAFGKPAGNANNNPFLGDTPFGAPDNDWGIDVNGDGVKDENDRYYVPGGFRTYSRAVESQRDSLNFTAQWQPVDDLNLYLDVSKADSEEKLHGSQMAIVTNAARSFIVPTMEYDAAPLGNGSYIMNSGTMAGASMRMGGAPSDKMTWRESEKVTFGGDYFITDNLQVEFSASKSEGESYTKQAQLNMGYDWDKNSQLNAIDWSGMTQYQLANGAIPNATLIESPFHPADGVAAPVDASGLVTLDPTNMSYDRLSYFQMQRNADDTSNSDESVKLDFTYTVDGNFLTQIKAGYRSATRAFERASYINSSQKNSKESDGLVEQYDIQEIKVDPAANADASYAQIATDLQSCLSPVSIDVGSSNLSSSWTSTTCGNDFFTDYFNMHDIRAFKSAKGAGYYETAGSRYNVEEDTTAAYLRADFSTELAGLAVFGNLGVRHVETETSSSGYVNNPAGSETAFSMISLQGEYSDTLPSLNLNIGLNEEMLIRIAGYEALARPGLGSISPGIRLNYNNDLGDGYAGTANMGNPNLEPIRATNLDISYEWYYSKDSMFAVAVFEKDLDSVIYIDAEQRSDVMIAGEKFTATQPQNQPGTEISGYELNLQHAFSSLPGLLSNTGLGVNYTYTTEDTGNQDAEGDDISRKGLSEDSYNLVAYYDDNTLSARLAYNWRSEFVRRESVSLGWNRPDVLPEIEDARGQLDFSANYKLSDNMKVNFSAVNLNNSQSVRFMKYSQLVNYIGDAGRRFNLGLVYRF